MNAISSRAEARTAASALSSQRGSTAANADAALIEACADHLRCHAAIAGTPDDSIEERAYLQALDRIAGVVPKSYAGIHALVQSIMTEARTPDGDLDVEGNVAAEWCFQAVRGLHGLMPKRAPRRRATALADEAAILALSERHLANRQAFNTNPIDCEADDDPLWLALKETNDALMEALPQTVDAVAAKARAAQVSANEEMAWSAIDDLLRVCGRLPPDAPIQTRTRA